MLVNRYRIEIDESELQLLACLEMPIAGYVNDGVADDFPSSVYLSTQAQQLEVTSKSEVLEHHFECFGLQVRIVDEQKIASESTAEWDGVGNRVELMIRREGLYTENDVKSDTIGSNPSTQKVIPPGGDYSGADAICDVTAGVCVTNVNGVRLLIYTDTFPFCVRIESDQQNVSKMLSKFELMTLEAYRQRF